MKTSRQLLTGLLGLCLAVPFAMAQTDCGDAVIVSSGDTLSTIANRCNTTVTAILDANRQLNDENAITAGSILTMPGVTSRSYSTGQPAEDGVTEILTVAEIDQLVAPIALYPDVLLAELLPAATYPLEVVQAARWRKINDDLDAVDEQDWAPSIKALVRYPDVLNKLNSELEWTVQLGDAFLTQPDAVFDGIQRMRTKAEAAGNLKTTEQQVVVREKTEVVEVIRIVPANPRYVYVPYYDPYAVYYPYHGARVVHSPAISFSTGFALGGWLNYQLNWGQRHIYHYDYVPAYYGGYRNRIISRHDRAHTHHRYDGRRWRHDHDRARRHYADRSRRYLNDRDRRQVENRGGLHRDALRGRDSHRSDYAERRDMRRGLRATGDRQVDRRNGDNREQSGQLDRTALNSREARLNRLQNRRTTDSRHIYNRLGNAENRPRRSTGTTRGDVRSAVSAGNTGERQRVDRRHDNRQQIDQSARNEIRMRRATESGAVVNRATVQPSIGRVEQSRARSQPRVNVQRRETPAARTSVPRNSNNARLQSSQSARVRTERSDRNSAVRGRHSDGNRGSNRPNRVREQRR